MPAPAPSRGRSDSRERERGSSGKVDLGQRPRLPCPSANNHAQPAVLINIFVAPPRQRLSPSRSPRVSHTNPSMKSCRGLSARTAFVFVNRICILSVNGEGESRFLFIALLLCSSPFPACLLGIPFSIGAAMQSASGIRGVKLELVTIPRWDRLALPPACKTFPSTSSPSPIYDA